MTTHKLALWGYWLLVLLMVAVPALQAQEPEQVFITYPELSEAGNGLNLGLYFTITDGNGQVVPDAPVRAARIVLDEGGSYDAEVSQPDTPFYITLVLDASGSMGGAVQDMQRAAASVVQSAPEAARIAVIQFNEQVSVLQDFTADRNRAINAIGSVQPVNLNGTCLYDAAYAAVEQAGGQRDGRRAIILFTDGQDEKADGSTCSRRTYDDVVNLATRSALRVPVHTIGLRGGGNPINEAELRNLAGATGGLAAFGAQADLGTLFRRIMDGLRSQWLATAKIYPNQGARTATLIVTGANGRLLQPAAITFTAPRSFALTATPSPTADRTATPIPVSVSIESVELARDGQQARLRLTVEGASLIREYRFSLKDAATNLLVGEFSLDPPLADPVSLPVGNLAGGQYAVRVDALARDGAILARSDEERFTITLPTATPSNTPTASPTASPTRPTNTPVPVGVTLNNLQFDEAAAQFRLGLTVLSPDRIGSVRVEFVSADTNALEKTYAPPVDSLMGGELTLPVEVRAGRYVVRIVSLGPDGQEVSRTELLYVHAPATATPSPTPTATETATPTATPITASAVISGIQDPQPGDDALIISVTVANEQLIRRYVVEFVDRGSNLVRESFAFDAPPHDTLRVPLDRLAGGEYMVVLKAIGEGGVELGQHSVQIGYTPPTVTPTPAPTDTPAPTPTATPIPVASAEWLQANQNILLPVIVVLVLGLLAVLAVLVRRSGQQTTGTGFLAELTGAQEALNVAPEYAPSDQPYDPDATNPVPQFDPDATNPVAQMLLPPATLTVTRTRATTGEGATVAVNHVPFVLGRQGRDARGSDLNFDGDDNVSRRHAEITFFDGAFYLTDLGSTHGTVLDGQPVAPRTPVRLHAGATIVLGTTTMLSFSVQAPDEGSSTA